MMVKEKEVMVTCHFIIQEKTKTKEILNQEKYLGPSVL